MTVETGERARPNEVVLQRVTQQSEVPFSRLSRSLAVKHVDPFNHEAYEAGSVRKLRFESQDEMETWLEAIREVTVEMILEWNEMFKDERASSNSVRATKVIKE